MAGCAASARASRSTPLRLRNDTQTISPASARCIESTLSIRAGPAPKLYQSWRKSNKSCKKLECFLQLFVILLALSHGTDRAVMLIPFPNVFIRQVQIWCSPLSYYHHSRPFVPDTTAQTDASPVRKSSSFSLSTACFGNKPYTRKWDSQTAC